MWQKELNTKAMQITDIFLIACSILLVTSGITNRPVLFILIGLLFIYIALNHFYDKAIHTLQLHNPKNTIRLFPGEHAILRFYFDNSSLFPFINGVMQFNMSGIKTICRPLLTNQENQQDSYEVPLAIRSRKQSVLEIPIRAEQRGTTTMNNIRYHFPHLFKFHPVKLSYIPFLKQEVLVYPKPKLVKGVRHYAQIAHGSGVTPYSPFEDIGNIIGTRNYNDRDPFHRINWKASVRAQQLQTNTYEKVQDTSFVIIINLEGNMARHHTNIHQKMEDFLSYATSIAHQLTEKGFPFEMFINVRKPGPIPFVHIQEGTGNAQYIHVLEMLGRIHAQPMIYPFEKMFYRISHDLMRPKTIIFIGDISADAMNRNAQRGMKHQMLKVTEADGEAFLTPLKKEGKHVI